MLNYDFIAKLDKIDNYNCNRLYAEINYAVEVSNVNGNKYDAIIKKAVDNVYESYIKDGAVTSIALNNFEKELEVMVSDCKKYELLLVAHAHIDMNWMWAYDETVAITLSTFETMLRLMDEYPQFKFSQSQASVYEIVEKYDKEMLEKIKQRIKEGRWEVTASQWVEGDKNMASGEDLSRHILETKNYLSKLLNINADSLNIAYEPDTFGHNQNMPEILSKGGVKYMYHCRGSKPNDIYRWVAPSGASVINFCEEEWYIDIIRKESFLGYVSRMKKWGINKYLKVYGVGDHGGGPTRRDLNYVIDMQSWPIMPKLTFATYKDWFTYIEEFNLDIPEVKGELNKVFTGCYTSQTRIKKANAENSRILVETEKAMALAQVYANKKVDEKALTTPWRNQLFNHFHDILPGSGVIDTREYSMGKSQELKAQCAVNKSYALKTIADNLNTVKFISKNELEIGAGYGALAGQGGQISSQIIYGETEVGNRRLYLLYNPSTEGEFIVKIRIYDYDGEFDFLKVTDGDGNDVDFEVDTTKNKEFLHYYNYLYVKVKMPSMGYKLIVISDDNKKLIINKMWNEPITEYNPKYVLEDEYLCVEINDKNGCIKKITDKISGKTYESDSQLGFYNLIHEGVASGMTSWIQGSPVKEEPIVDFVITEDRFRNKIYKNGNVIKTIEYSVKFGESSKMTMRVSLQAGVINLDSKIFFHEQDRDLNFVKSLEYKLNVPFDKYLYDIPYGVIERVSKDRFDEPSLSFVCGLDANGNGLMLQSEGKNGFKGSNEGMKVSLIRNSYAPEQCPENITHEINIKISTVKYTSNLELLKQAERQRTPISYISVKAGKGTLPLTASLVDVKGAMLTSFKAVDGGYILRVVETDGNDTLANININGVKQAYLCDGVENILEILDFDVNGVNINVKPYSINTVKIEI